MNARSKDEIRDIVFKDLQVIHDRRTKLSERLRENLENDVSYVRELFAQLSQPSSGPLVPKTPKLLRRKVMQRIETIPEDEVFQQENASSKSFVQSVHDEEQEEKEVACRRTQRGASRKAADIIKKQSINEKKVKRESQKRKKSSSSGEDDESLSKYSKIEENLTEVKKSTRRTTRKTSKQISEPISEKVKENEKPKKNDNSESLISSTSSKDSRSRKANKVSDTIIVPNVDDEESSMYEDAIGKPIPIMNSTLKHNMPEKVLNATVVLERLPQQPKLNETVVIQKLTKSSKRSNEEENKGTKRTLQDSVQSNKTYIQYNNCDGLITDDESSPEVKKLKKQIGKKQNIIISSDDEISNMPVKTRIREIQDKVNYKSNALFSPYAKESVKKRVEAFEQAVQHSPKSVTTDAPVRVTRTKTRAMAKKEMEKEPQNAEKTITQILARKSLMKAKRISLAKQMKNDEFKEVKESVNKEQAPERIYKVILTQTDKTNTKQIQQSKTTPISKLKLMQPILSVNRLQTPSNTQNLSNYSKTLTVSRANIITSADSFIQPPKSITKTNSVEKLEEKKQEEDARKKREEALRIQTEEKRRKRQEKELKNKLAREAKEKSNLEKRQKAEKEKEEKAKLALKAQQEKQREEQEKKRLAQWQRAQEKEERRKLEEQQKLQKQQDQEETERLLADQRRREQEAEKRREAEARTQQAAIEALKQKQLHAAKYKQVNNKGGTNYVLDSEPDDDETDDEDSPKHEIPYWAQSHVRKVQLANQQYIPEIIVYKFFNTRKCTPDLTELFHGIDRNRLKRTSSAIWKTPPRISMMETELIQGK